MLLKKLIKNLPSIKKDIIVKGLAVDSKKIKKGFIFFAIKGFKSSGERFIKEAIEKGAIAIVCSKQCTFYHQDIPIVKSTNTRHLLSEISSKFYRLKPG